MNFFFGFLDGIVKESQKDIREIHSLYAKIEDLMSKAVRSRSRSKMRKLFSKAESLDNQAEDMAALAYQNWKKNTASGPYR